MQSKEAFSGSIDRQGHVLHTFNKTWKMEADNHAILHKFKSYNI